MDRGHSPGRSRALGLWAAAGLAGAAAFAILHAFQPPSADAFLLCPLRRLLGIPCPGCGMTRALAHLAKGEWRAAVALHPLAPLLAAELALGWMAAGLAAAGWLGTRWRAWLPDVLGAHAALFVALWAGRLATGTWPR